MSQRPACRSGIRASKPGFLIVIVRPSSDATFFAASTSKPTAAFGSVTVLVAKYSSGGYSMSPQSTSLPAVIRLVGGGIETVVAAGDPGAALGAAVGIPWVGLGEVPAPQPATNAATIA